MWFLLAVGVWALVARYDAALYTPVIILYRLSVHPSIRPSFRPSVPPCHPSHPNHPSSVCLPILPMDSLSNTGCLSAVGCSWRRP